MMKHIAVNVISFKNVLFKVQCLSFWTNIQNKIKNLLYYEFVFFRCHTTLTLGIEAQLCVNKAKSKACNWRPTPEHTATYTLFWHCSISIQFITFFFSLYRLWSFTNSVIVLDRYIILNCLKKCLFIGLQYSWISYCWTGQWATM